MNSIKETLHFITKNNFSLLITTALNPFLKINHDMRGCQSLAKGN